MGVLVNKGPGRILLLTTLLFAFSWHTYAQDTTEVVEIEYFFDIDPGFGAGTSISVGPDTLVTLSAELNTSTLSNGFHTLGMRARNLNRREWYNVNDITPTILYPDSIVHIDLLTAGQWGFTDTRMIFIDQSYSVEVQLVDSLEYFFDEDPGFGNGIIIDDFTAMTTQSFMRTLTSDTLSFGFHVLFMRAKAEGGAWGLSESRLVFIDPAGAGIASSIDSLEYFFDVDPGYGNGTTIEPPDFTVGPTVSIEDFILTTDTLPTGFHVLYLRAKVEGGAWGMPESRLLFIDQSSSAEIQLIDTLEYFFDEDPGFGNGITIDNFTPGTNLSFPDEILTADTLAYGFHVLFVRAKAVGGAWGMPESRVIFIDQSDAGQAIIVDQIEYFFDNDPGYGMATSIAVGPANTINFMDSLNADTLSVGFHTLGLRARSEDGEWGTTETRLVYVDQVGIAIKNIVELEYFFDTDPGYGNATSIPITPSTTNLVQNIALAAASLPEGLHVVGVRARDEENQWSVYESAQFSTYGPGRELDSASLAFIYKQLDGPNWTNRTNWLTGALDTWYGVDVVNTRVDSVRLSNNNLSGELPLEAGYILNLKKLDLSGNNLIDTISGQLVDLTLLQQLLLYDNRIDELADLSAISSLNTVSLDSNLFDFGDLEPYVGVSNFTYSNQKIYNEFPIDSIAKISDPMTINKTIKGANNIFQWYLNDDPISGADLEDYTLPAYLPSDSGVYILRATNTILPGLELVTEPFHLRISDFEEDSLALVSLYNSTAGASWTDGSNWLTGTLDTWNGVTVQNQRVTDLILSANNLDGHIPWDFGYADSLVNVDLSNNLLRDSLPDSWEQFYALVTADLSQNDIVSIPNLKPLGNSYFLNTLDVVGNRLQFADIETNIGIPVFNYNPQDSISFFRDTLFDAGTPSFLEFTVSGSNNTYQWYRADFQPPNTEATITGSVYDTLYFENPVFEDEDWYRLEINSTIVTDLTLTSGYVNLGISSLKRDSTALMRLYEETNGENWVLNTNWGTGDVFDWVGVQLNDDQDRVIAVSLPDNNLNGPVPARFRDITKLESANFSNNEINTLPNMTFMQRLASLDVSQNRLGFEEIKVNLNVPGFVYANQKNIRIDNPVRRLQYGSDDTLNVEVSGQNNTYQWSFNQFQGVSEGEITDATDPFFFLDSLRYTNMGTYFLTVNNPDVPDLELRSDPFEMIAVTDVFGQVFDPFQAPYPKGDVILLKVVDGPFTQLDTSQVDGNAEYLFEDVDLGDYVLQSRPNVIEDPTFIQTYTGNSIYWEEADTLKLREPAPGQEIVIQREPDEIELGEASISGFVETDFPDDARIDEIETRKRVARLGCSVRKFRSAGRGEDDHGFWELYAYIESDENGEFDFTQLPEGLYLFNVQYPGVPMNPDSDIELEVKPNSKIELEAVVNEESITINDVTLGLPHIIASFNLYPNPAADKATIDYQVTRPIDDLGLKVYTLSGQKIMEETIGHRIGFHNHTLDVSGWTKGVYFVVLQNQGKDMLVQLRLIVKD